MITDIAGRGFQTGDIVAFSCNEVKEGNRTYKACGMQLGVVRGVSKNDKVLVRMPSGFGGYSTTFDTYIRNEKNSIVLSQFVIPEIDQFQELFDIRADLM